MVLLRAVRVRASTLAGRQKEKNKTRPVLHLFISLFLHQSPSPHYTLNQHTVYMVFTDSQDIELHTCALFRYGDTHTYVAIQMRSYQTKWATEESAAIHTPDSSVQGDLHLGCFTAVPYSV